VFAVVEHEQGGAGPERLEDSRHGVSGGWTAARRRPGVRTADGQSDFGRDVVVVGDPG
jgi:hypothetical protein